MLFDKDNSGTIDIKELEAVMKAIGMVITDPKELQDLINEADSDRSGTVDFQEFCILMSKKMRDIDTDEELSEFYKILDRDGDNRIEW